MHWGQGLITRPSFKQQKDRVPDSKTHLRHWHQSKAERDWKKIFKNLKKKHQNLIFPWPLCWLSAECVAKHVHNNSGRREARAWTCSGLMKPAQLPNMVAMCWPGLAGTGGGRRWWDFGIGTEHFWEGGGWPRRQTGLSCTPAPTNLLLIHHMPDPTWVRIASSVCHHFICWNEACIVAGIVGLLDQEATIPWFKKWLDAGWLDSIITSYFKGGKQAREGAKIVFPRTTSCREWQGALHWSLQ